MDGEHTEVLSHRYVGMRTACVCTHTCVCLCVRCMCEHVCAVRGVYVCVGRVGICMGYECVVWCTGGMCAFVFLVIPFMLSLLLGSSMVTQSLDAAGLQVQGVAEVASVTAEWLKKVPDRPLSGAEGISAVACSLLPTAFY